MARPSKGDRVVTVTRVQRPVWEQLRDGAAARGISISAYTADILAAALGRDDLVRESEQEGLPLAM
jgi:hypothetical protein